ncbi:spidroin_N domain-containing protein [Caerostris extrusa]|uniref:Spidroin_N domain-containing protein n=1 Tax=Caerostris extrusa TaxID=172846 RepID=A0AAV4Y8E1_CAEEX|nr:spidroin_N domain-containing protein [Caerostris extrusa]
MDWHIHLLFALIFALQQGCFTNGKRFDFSYNNPFANYDTAEAFTRSFVHHVISSHVFGNQGVQDIEGTVDTLIMAMKESTLGQTESRARIKAMTMAFASSIAELIVSENSQEMDIQKKTNLVIDALKSAFEDTTGEVNQSFINQMPLSALNDGFGIRPYPQKGSGRRGMPFNMDNRRMGPEMIGNMGMRPYSGVLPGQMAGGYDVQGNMMPFFQYMSGNKPGMEEMLCKKRLIHQRVKKCC